MLERFWTIAKEPVAAFRSLIGAHARLMPHAQSPAVRARAIEAGPAPLSRADGWTRATGAITAAIAGFERIRDLQAAAASRLDAADYALQRLLEDLAMVMPAAIPIPADGSALRAVLAEAAQPPARKKALAA
jgi:hypothetical protein